MAHQEISSTIEDYLGIIYVMERDHEPVVGARIATLLGVTPPTVTNTLKRMIRDELLETDPKSNVHLTTQGWDYLSTIKDLYDDFIVEH